MDKEKQDESTVTVRLSAKQLGLLDSAAKARGISRSVMLRDLIATLDPDPEPSLESRVVACEGKLDKHEQALARHDKWLEDLEERWKRMSGSGEQGDGPRARSPRMGSLAAGASTSPASRHWFSAKPGAKPAKALYGKMTRRRAPLGRDVSRPGIRRLVLALIDIGVMRSGRGRAAGDASGSLRARPRRSPRRRLRRSCLP